MCVNILVLPKMKSMAEIGYENAWRKLRRVRVIAAFAVLAWVIWLIAELFLDPGFEITRQLVISGGACAAFWSYAILRYNFWLCPRCRYPFQTTWIVGPWSVWPRDSCIHCGLKVGT